jgi:hypothetical protein
MGQVRRRQFERQVLCDVGRDELLLCHPPHATSPTIHLVVLPLPSSLHIRTLFEFRYGSCTHTWLQHDP